MHTHKLTALTLVCALLTPLHIAAQEVPDAPWEQDFMITAYYSPLADQCCYVTGTYAQDKVLNGEGLRGADGTEVYAGMAAAPATYPFGTRIILPGIGSVTVHDRGGAIRVLEDGVHRLDLWVGHGEEGLARALAFGVQRVRGTVYPPGTAQPGESLDLLSLASPLDILKPFMALDPDLLALRPKKGDRGPSVQLLQEHLRDAGYFPRSITGFFGEETADAFRAFLTDYGLTAEPQDALSERSAAFLVAAVRRKTATFPIPTTVERTSSEQTVGTAQRTLRALGYYSGRTNGVYDDALFNAILQFQMEAGLVGDASMPGAGRIGPRTLAVLTVRWRRMHAETYAERLIALRKIDLLLAERGRTIGKFLSKGDRGKDVTALQTFLTEQGYFPEERISGLFGEVTEEALRTYQIAAGIITSITDRGAGIAGPATLASVRRAQRRSAYKLVRANGWKVL
ncbi:MAG: peptidoglycan-binding protein [Candidatus Peregrinibacteria bacterium]|nr:peptidoglycan-binding protein [Candidatus Peregrinibacteria bacterium]